MTVLRRGPLTDAGIAHLTTLSRDELEKLGRHADAMEDETLGLAIVAEHGRRFAHDAIETSEMPALDHLGVEVDEPSLYDELEAEFGGVFEPPSIANAVRR